MGVARVGMRITGVLRMELEAGDGVVVLKTGDREVLGALEMVIVVMDPGVLGVGTTGLEFIRDTRMALALFSKTS